MPASSSSSPRSTKSFSARSLSPKLFGAPVLVLPSLSSPLAFALSSPPPNTELELVVDDTELKTLPNALLPAYAEKAFEVIALRAGDWDRSGLLGLKAPSG